MTETSPATTPLTTNPGYRLEYIIGHEAWYADANKMVEPNPYLSVIKAHQEGGCDWELQIIDRSATIGKPAIQVTIFDDAFAAFAELAPLFTALADQQPTTLGQVRNILDRLGFVDATARTSPYGTSDRAAGEAARLRAKAAELTSAADRIEGQETRRKLDTFAEGNPQ
jgi:hypothetical protein